MQGREAAQRKLWAAVSADKGTQGGAPGVSDQLHLSRRQGENAGAFLELLIVLWN